ncbi:C40 family peptidase [Aquimarina sp. 2201CG5-10]|uniref:C40 family peptidase n=1 Tax=Aquimarina callyspongiae TaxID=3098150 RepID=UPI002AB3CE27|nr:C40 family peptidase [Aquimarina sp. 2201CG5-10]MDY8138342.1 C40 family peptidase [Aquimarina sp. 2201CG5-10]
MNIFCKTLAVFIVLIGMVSCGGAKKAQEEALAQARKDSIARAQQNAILPIQKKYGTILSVSPKEIKPVTLYKFIDNWMDTPYKMGGETKDGIDCSFFSQYLFHDVFGHLIERTAQKQYDAPDTDKFIGQEFLKLGDLLFFNERGSEHMPITHVGVYLGNDRFVHSTARKETNSGKNGVQISVLSKRHWQKMFVAAGRKPGITKALSNQ